MQHLSELLHSRAAQVTSLFPSDLRLPPLRRLEAQEQDRSPGDRAGSGANPDSDPFLVVVILNVSDLRCPQCSLP